MRDRTSEHESSIRTNDQTNAMAKHMAIHHPQEAPAFKYKVDQVFKTTLARQIAESILIQEENQDLLMNSKSEWGSKNTIPRIIVTTETSAQDLPQVSPLQNSDLNQDRPRKKMRQKAPLSHYSSPVVDIRLTSEPQPPAPCSGQGNARLFGNVRKRKANDGST